MTALISSVNKQRKSTRVLSKAVEAAVESRARAKPIAVQGISTGHLVTINPTQFGKLDVDPGYQRGKTNIVNQIVRALQAGGKVLDPVTLCQRKFGERNGKMWIVDGFQRVCAFQELKLPFQAMLHESDSIEAEADFFIALNARRSVNANVIVKAWHGPSSQMLIKANEDPLHPLYSRINFEQGSNTGKFAASVLVRGLLSVTGSDRSFATNLSLSRLDFAMKGALDRARCEHLLRLLGMVSRPKGQLPAIVIRALGTVARERWIDDVYLPNPKSISKLVGKDWMSEAMLLNAKYFSILTDTIRKAWRS